MEDDAMWIASSFAAVEWEEKLAFVWWFKVRQIARRYHSCDTRSVHWEEECRRISEHVPFCPRLGFVSLDTPASVTEFVEAISQLRTCLKWTSPLALPLPPLRARPLLQPFFLEQRLAADAVDYPAPHRKEDTRESRIFNWAALLGAALRSLAKDRLKVRIRSFSHEDLQLAGEGCFFHPWVVSTLHLAACRVSALEIEFHPLNLPAVEELVRSFWNRILHVRTSTSVVHLRFHGSCWKSCQRHRELFQWMKQTIRIVPHPFEFRVTCTHDGSTFALRSLWPSPGSGW